MTICHKIISRERKFPFWQKCSEGKMCNTELSQFGSRPNLGSRIDEGVGTWVNTDADLRNCCCRAKSNISDKLTAVCKRNKLDNFNSEQCSFEVSYSEHVFRRPTRNPFTSCRERDRSPRQQRLCYPSATITHCFLVLTSARQAPHSDIFFSMLDCC